MDDFNISLNTTGERRIQKTEKKTILTLRPKKTQKWEIQKSMEK